MIKTRFEVGSSVFIYQKGKLIPTSVDSIDARISVTENIIKYGFKFSKQPDAPALWIPEDEVFATKEEIVTK